MILTIQILRRHWLITVLSLLGWILMFILAGNIKAQTFPAYAPPNPLMVHWTDTNGCSYTIWRGVTNGPVCPKPQPTNFTVSSNIRGVFQTTTVLNGAWRDVGGGDTVTLPIVFLGFCRQRVDYTFVVYYGPASHRYTNSIETTSNSVVFKMKKGQTNYVSACARIGDREGFWPVKEQVKIAVCDTNIGFSWKPVQPTLTIAVKG